MKTPIFITIILVFSSILAKSQISLIKDINTTPNAGCSSFASDYDTLNGWIYFSARDSLYNTELWKTDGTENGTIMAVDVEPGPGGSIPENIRNVNGILYFSATNSMRGRELYKSDGTTSGTAFIKDINVGIASSNPADFIYFQNKVYFTADDGIHGKELWVTDGTSAGTHIFIDLTSGSSSTDYKKFVVAGSHLFFKVGTNRLYSTTGSASSVTLLHNGTWSQDVEEMISFNGHLYFTRNLDLDLWKSDGTLSGTQFVYKANSSNYIDGARNLTVFNGNLYFISSSTTNSIVNLYKHNGLNTVMIKNLGSTLSLQTEKPLPTSNNRFYIATKYQSNKTRIWQSDGTVNGTTAYSSIVNNFPISYYTGTSNGVIVVGKIGNYNNIPKLYKFQSGSSSVSTIINFSSLGLSNYHVLGIRQGTKYVFTLNGNNGKEPWVFSDNNDSLYMLKDIGKGTQGSILIQYGDPVSLNGKVFFTAQDPTHGAELWYSDGTENGTQIVKDIYVGSNGSYPRYLTISGNWIYFLAKDN